MSVPPKQSSAIEINSETDGAKHHEKGSDFRFSSLIQLNVYWHAVNVQ